MIIVLKPNTDQKMIHDLRTSLEESGVKIHLSQGIDHTILGVVGDTSRMNEEGIKAHHFVEKVLRVQEPYKMANREFHPTDTLVKVSGADNRVRTIGEGFFSIMAGPCSVESEEQLITIARQVKKSGAGFLRGGAFKPRTSPYAFQGLGCEGIELLLAAKKETGLPIVTELMAINQLEIFDKVDIIQVGARNMQNFNLLRELGHCDKPILLKRGMSSTVKEWLMSAEYIMAGGNENVILCERGIRTFDTSVRNTLDLSCIPLIKKKSHLPVIVDPSHATGLSWMVEPMAKAAIAAGADGILIEVHNNPEKALCDGEQSITPEQFQHLMQKIEQYAILENRRLSC